MQANRETLRRFIAAAVWDLIDYLDTLDEPFIVGGQYPRDNLIRHFREWCDSRNFSVVDADGKGWLITCTVGALKTPGKLPIQNKGDLDAST